jgi:putative tryptophan/tyrosine transport system substrate-binding protein
MKRREFITIISGAVAWSVSARAQQTAMPVIGFLNTRSPDESRHLVASFRQGLMENGYAEGQNVIIEYRWAQGQYDRLTGFAAELASRPVAVLAATGGEAAALATKAATVTVPVVATFSADPVERGLVTSLSRPGGNMTGVSNLASTLEPKRFGLLHELMPQARRFGVLLNPKWPSAELQLRDMEEAARAIGVASHVLRASTDPEIDAAFESIAQHRIPALAVVADAFLNTRREKLAALAARYGVPAMYSFRDYAVAGGLMSYGIDLPDVYRQVGIYVGRILSGAKPADLPITQPTKFEFVINLKAAKALGIKISDNLLSLADEVIE